MKQITFDNIFTLGEVVTETEEYIHFHYPDMLTRYDSNFIKFKVEPSMNYFKEMEVYLRDYYLEKGQNHVKFTFPDNTNLAKDLTAYLKENGYETGFLELYAINPKNYPSVSNNPDVEIQVVTDVNLELYLELQYRQDVKYGVEFAEQKAELIKRQLLDPNIRQLLAFYKETPVGYVDIIISDGTVEIDNLAVEEQYRNKGIGSQLQKFAMDAYPEKTVVLVADGEDTPRDMYKKQNYQCLGFKYETLRIYKD